MPNSLTSSIQVTPLVLTVCAMESSFSNSTTLAPPDAAAYAADEPAGPPPTTITSVRP